MDLPGGETCTHAHPSTHTHRPHSCMNTRVPAHTPTCTCMVPAALGLVPAAVASHVRVRGGVLIFKEPRGSMETSAAMVPRPRNAGPGQEGVPAHGPATGPRPQAAQGAPGCGTGPGKRQPVPCQNQASTSFSLPSAPPTHPQRSSCPEPRLDGGPHGQSSQDPPLAAPVATTGQRNTGVGSLGLAML